MASRANEYFKLLQNWASERVKGAAPGSRAAAFDFSRVQDWQPDLIDKPVRCQLSVWTECGQSVDRVWTECRQNVDRVTELAKRQCNLAGQVTC
jgi:hypothetical protein